MSLDINWSLLSDPPTPFHPTEPNHHDAKHPHSNGNNPFPLDSKSLTTHLISVLNSQLSSASRPSFIGPIEITNLDFGSNAPDIEIKDIRDVWRAFDEDDDDEEDEEDEGVQPEREAEYEEEYRFDSRRASGRSSDFNHGQVNGHGHGHGPGHGNGQQYDALMSPGGASTSRFPMSPGIGIGMAGLGMGRAMRDYGDRERDVFDDNASVFSEGRRQSIHAVGLGPRGLGLSRAPSINGHGHGYGYAASVMSHPLSPGISVRHPALTHTHISHPTSPARPPIKPVPKKTPSPIPSLQLHINLTHTSDLTLTLLTSLTVRYPASVFMSLPLKLSITGLQLAADIILAFDGEKNRVHLTILDDDDGMSGVPVGMRLLPEMRIESEIGHSDAHVLRNVGKIERFIADAVRKTLVDELVFPNFHTIAL